MAEIFAVFSVLGVLMDFRRTGLAGRQESGRLGFGRKAAPLVVLVGFTKHKKFSIIQKYW